MKVKFDDVRTTQISNDTCPDKRFGLLIANLREEFPVPFVSPFAIPEWSKHNSDDIEVIFEFVFHFLYNDAHIFLFVLESKNVRLDVRIFTAIYEFNLIRDWWGINSMHLQRYV